MAELYTLRLCPFLVKMVGLGENRNKNPSRDDVNTEG